jgi:hypothetical protein
MCRCLTRRTLNLPGPSGTGLIDHVRHAAGARIEVSQARAVVEPIKGSDIGVIDERRCCVHAERRRKHAFAAACSKTERRQR